MLGSHLRNKDVLAKSRKLKNTLYVDFIYVTSVNKYDTVTEEQQVTHTNDIRKKK